MVAGPGVPESGGVGWKLAVFITSPSAPPLQGKDEELSCALEPMPRPGQRHVRACDIILSEKRHS